MSKLKQRFSHKFIFSIVVSYIIIATIPFCCMIYTYYRSENELKNQVFDTTEKNMNACLVAIEKKISSYPIIANSVQSSEAMADLLSAMAAGRPITYSTIQISDMLAELITDFADTMYCYLPGNNYCISPFYNAYSDEFFNTFYTFDESFTRGDLNNALSSFSYSRYFVTQDPDGEKYIDFFYNLPLRDTTSEIQCTCVFRLSYENIQNTMESYMTTEDKNIYFIDKRGNSVFESVNYPKYNRLEYERYTDSILSLPGNIQFSKNFSATSWLMVLSIPKTNISRSLIPLRSVIMIVMVFCLVLSVVLAKFFSSLHYKPIEKLLSIFPDDDSNRDEYEKLNNAFSAIQEQKNALSKLRTGQESLQVNLFLSSLIYGNTEKYTPLDKYMKKFNISFVSDIFCVIVFYIKNSDMLFNEDDSQNYDNYENSETITFIIKNVFEEIVNEKQKGYVFEYNSLISAIVSIETDRLSSWHADIARAVERTNAFISKNFYFSVSAGISNIHTGISNLRTAFEEACKVFDYHLHVRNTPYISYIDTIPSDTGNDKQLLNVISGGDFELSKKIIDELFEKAGKAPHEKEFLKFKIISSIFTAVSDTENRLDNDIYENIAVKAEKVLKQEDDSESYDTLTQLLRFACDNCRSHQEDTCRKEEMLNTTITERIKSYIKENYKDQNLNVSSVGYHFNITPYYLSSLFKKAEGISILEYITKTRIEASIEILKDGATLSEASEASGFSSTHTYIRQFNKLMGCPPKQYINNL